MTHETQVRLVERVLEHLDDKNTHMAAGTTTGDPQRYIDPARFKKERTLFDSFPRIVAHASQLRNPGDFVVHSETGHPLLIVRGGDGLLRAFQNICRHRGTQLCAESGTGAKAFVCPYHSWSYRLDGSLLHIPHEIGFADLDRAALALEPRSVGCAAGFVWAVGSEGPCEPESHLGHLAEELAALGLGEHVVHHPVRMQKSFNWKLGIEIFLEAYHVKKVHGQSIYSMFFDNVGLFDDFAPHMRNIFPKRTVTQLRDVDRSLWRLREHANVLYYLFPNTLMLVQSDHVSVFHLYPRSVNTTEVVGYTLVPEPVTTEKAEKYWQKNIDILHGAVQEDILIGESIQRGASYARRYHYGRFEQSLDQLQRAIDDRLC